MASKTSITSEKYWKLSKTSGKFSVLVPFLFLYCNFCRQKCLYQYFKDNYHVLLPSESLNKVLKKNFNQKRGKLTKMAVRSKTGAWGSEQIIAFRKNLVGKRKTHKIFGNLS